MLAKLLAAARGHRVFQIALAVELGRDLRTRGPFENARRAAAAGQHACERRHGGAFGSHGRQRDDLGALRVSGDRVQHRVQCHVRSVAIDDRRCEMPVHMDRGIERAQRHRRLAGTADGERPDPDQPLLGAAVARHPSQQHTDRDLGLGVGGGPYQGWVHEGIRLGGAREEIEPGRPYHRISCRIGDLDGHALRRAPWNGYGLDVVLQCRASRPAVRDDIPGRTEQAPRCYSPRHCIRLKALR